MSKTLSRALFLLGLIVIFPTMFAKGNLTITAVHEYKFPISEDEYQKGEPPEPTRSQLSIWCYLKNEGTDPVRVATAYSGSSINIGGVANAVELAITPKEGPLGIVVVPSEAELKIVTLNQGESALVEWQHIGGVHKAKIDQLTITLRIDHSVAARFGLWSGKLTAESKRVRTGY